MNTNTELANRPTRGDTLKALLEDSKARIAEILPRHLKPERMIRIALAAAHRNPKIAQCTPISILNCLVQASELGLEPGGALRHAYLIPYGNECTFQPSYMGLLELARRSGAFKVIEARTVHARDTFDIVYTPAAEFSHAPWLGEDRGDLTHAYAYAVLASGALALEVATRAEVETARKQSRAQNSLMWTQFYDEGAKKVAIKRLLKRQACSADLATAIELDNREYDLEGPAAPPVRHATRSAALGALLAPPPDPEPAFAAGTSGRIGTEPEDETPDPDLEDEPGSDG